MRETPLGIADPGGVLKHTKNCYTYFIRADKQTDTTSESVSMYPDMEDVGVVDSTENPCVIN